MAKADKASKAEEKSDGGNTEPNSTSHSDWHWADPKNLRVNPVFQSLIPLQSRGEFMALEQSI